VTTEGPALPEEQHKAADKRSEIVLAVNFGRGAESKRSEHLPAAA